MSEGEYIDLHVHSLASDGTDSPEKIVELASELGLKAIALTDHDTVAGLARFHDAGKRFPGVETISGVEISCVFCNREIHIVGLFINPESSELNGFLSVQCENRVMRNRDICRKLASLGYALNDDEPEFALQDAGNVGRPHIARALMRRYGFSSLTVVFEKLLGHGRAAFVPRTLPDAASAIAVIHAAGGVAVWAHPVYRDRNERAWLKRGLRKLSAFGLDGVEGYYSLFGPNETALVKELAALYQVAISGGSDYHGENSVVNLGFGAGGLRVPVELLQGLKKKRDSRLIN